MDRYGKGRCPSCREPIQWDMNSPQNHYCQNCGKSFVVQEKKPPSPPPPHDPVANSLQMARRWVDRYESGTKKPPERSVQRRYKLRRVGQGWLTEYPKPVEVNRHLALLDDNIDLLYWIATRERLYGVHYNQFQVGSAILAYNPNNPGRPYRIFSGMNSKVVSNGRPTCAEVVATAELWKHGYTQVIAIMVVGLLRDEDKGVLKTLHPCDSCQLFCAHHPAYRPWSRIITAYPPSQEDEQTGVYSGVYEVHSLQMMLRVHNQPFSCT